jgi:DNA-binding NtrC family response regulator
MIMAVTTFDSAVGVIEALRQGRPDAVIADIRMPGMSGLELLARLRERLPELPVIIMTAHSDLDSAVSAYQGGAFEYLPKPFDVDEAVAWCAALARPPPADGTAAAACWSPCRRSSAKVRRCRRFFARLAGCRVPTSPC